MKELRQALTPLQDKATDYDRLLELSENRSFIMMGEASHGSHEFYQARVDITKRLIKEQGLNAIAVEADWPAAYRINRYVRGLGSDTSVEQALGDFHRFPVWMWRNTVTRDFVQWLRDYNQGRSLESQVGFYGLDMYSMYESIACVLDYLEQVDPEAAEQAREGYSCLDNTQDEQAYGFGVMLGNRPSCEDEALQQLMRLTSNALEYCKRDGMLIEDEQFQAEQNARLIRNAERYYRTMFTGRVSTWNLRDRHMSDTLEDLWQHLNRRNSSTARIAVWEHNSHVGDARATEMGHRGEYNVGQLARERHGEGVLLLGFSTYEGTVSAASSWGGPVERKAVNPGLPGSYEALFHSLGETAFFLELGDKAPATLHEPRLQRAIGVLHMPDSERRSHYFNCHLTEQFDAVLHFDTTRALEPLDHLGAWQSGAPDTYPFGV
jgi:erythromycin esterase-like protein